MAAKTTTLASAGAAGLVLPKAIARRVLHLLREVGNDPVSAFGFVVLTLIILAAIFAPALAPHDPAEQVLRSRLAPPFWMDGGSTNYLLGADYLGRDILSRILYGARVSLSVAGLVVLIAGSFGVVLGLLAGYYGGRIDSIVTALIDIQLAFPGILLQLLILMALGSSVGMLVAALSVSGWMVFATMTRGIVLSMKQASFVEAAQIIGARPTRIILRHLLPNLASPLLTLAMLECARVILVEAGLSFLGLGIQPPDSSWGLDIATGKGYIFNAWWLVTFPGLAIALTVLSVNLVASWTRVTLDPQERERRFAVRHRARAARRPVAASPANELDPSYDVLLSVRDLAVHFHTRDGTVQGARGVSFDVAQGETLGIVGESGSGKSVTAQAVMGLVATSGEIVSGDVLWKGRSILGEGNPHARQIRGKDLAIVFQDPMTSMDPLFTVGSQIGEVLRHHLGMDAAAAKLRTIELLTLVGITAPHRRIDQYPHELSGGMRQRVMIATALACEPKLLIADEPTTALDVTIQSQILDLLLSLQEKMGLAIVLITHDLGVVARMCDRVAVMYGGRIVESGSLTETFRNPVHPYTSSLLRATPRLSTRSSRLESIDGQPPNLVDPGPGCMFAPRCDRVLGQCHKSQPDLVNVSDESSAACWNAADSATSQR